MNYDCDRNLSGDAYVRRKAQVFITDSNRQICSFVPYAVSKLIFYILSGKWYGHGGLRWAPYIPECI